MGSWIPAILAPVPVLGVGQGHRPRPRVDGDGAGYVPGVFGDLIINLDLGGGAPAGIGDMQNGGNRFRRVRADRGPGHAFHEAQDRFNRPGGRRVAVKTGWNLVGAEAGLVGNDRAIGKLAHQDLEGKHLRTADALVKKTPGYRPGRGVVGTRMGGGHRNIADPLGQNIRHGSVIDRHRVVGVDGVNNMVPFAGDDFIGGFGQGYPTLENREGVGRL